MSEAELKEISSLCEEGIGLNECTLALKVPTLIAEIRRLNKQLADAPTVYFQKDIRAAQFRFCHGHNPQYPCAHVDTQAKLVEIKKIGEGE